MADSHRAVSRHPVAAQSVREPVSQLAGSLYRSLQESGIEVLWDDRDERAGVKFNDAGPDRCPFHLVIGEKAWHRAG